ncbi:MAG: hypothetical protein ABL921_28605 [Pirellula sp.]
MFRFLFEIPLALLRSVGETFEWILLSFSSQDEDDSETERRPWWKTLLFLPFLLPYWVFLICLAIIAFPFAALRFEGERRTKFLWGVPALITFGMFIAATIYAISTREAVTGKYVQLMQQAMKDGDFKLASTLGGRLIADSKVQKPEIAFQYATALAQSGDSEKAKSIVNSLAPDSLVGFAPAHQMRAIQLARSLSADADKKSLESFRWHLTNSGTVMNEQLLLLWVVYHQRVGQTGEAIKKLEQAAKINPAHLVSVSDLYRQTGDEAASKRHLVSALESFQRTLDSDPLATVPRLQLALVQTKLAQFEEAEKTLLKGVSISRDANMLRASAEFYVLRYDMAVQEKQLLNLKTCFGYLESALRLDPSYSPIYDRLIQLYGSHVAEHRESTIKLLEELIVDGKHAAVAHFALSSVKIMQGDKEDAMQHLEQAFRLSPSMPVVCNNLAWIMASGNPPKLDEALELSKKAVNAVPESASFRDTLGTILLLKQMYPEAIAELEIALSTGGSNKKLHTKLSMAYKELGNIQISEMHAAKAQ